MSDATTRRGFIQAGALAAGAAALGVETTYAQPTPSCQHAGATVHQTEGPFFLPRSPLRADLIERAVPGGRVLELTGTVITRTCRPVEKALVDLWHADEKGDYDERGFHYRGHQFTDAQGRFRFRTLRPAQYPGRTPHYHVKVQAAGRPVLTTQLYFPDEAGNRRDGLFKKELLMRLAPAPEGFAAQFDFVLDIA